MEKKFLSEMGLARLISHIKTAISGKADASALSGKQDKLTGKAGQVVGFDKGGNAIAQDAPQAENSAALLYGECSTLGDQSQKLVSCPAFELVEGAMIVVKFGSQNSADDPSLNVNRTGAKYIYYAGDTLTDQNAAPASALKAERLYLFRYNGSVYEIVGAI